MCSCKDFLSNMFFSIPFDSFLGYWSLRQWWFWPIKSAVPPGHGWESNALSEELNDLVKRCSWRSPCWFWQRSDPDKFCTAMWTDILLVYHWGDFWEFGTAQQVFGNRQQVFPVRSHKSIITDFDKAFWQHMLQEPMDKIKCWQSGCLPLIGVAVFKAICSLPPFMERFWSCGWWF